MVIDSLETSWNELRNQFVFSRLLIEDDAVEGTCWFAKRREDDVLHIFANCLRITLILLVAPLYALTPTQVSIAVVNFFHASWATEVIDTPNAVLANSPGGGGPAKYEVSHMRPQWMLEVGIKNGGWTYRQVSWHKTMWLESYVALSYPYASAKELHPTADEEDHSPTSPDSPYSPFSEKSASRPYKQHRREVAAKLLSVYIDNMAASGKTTTQYVWLDEFCLSEEGASESVAKAQRSMELGRLADIFRQAAEVCVFCHLPGCTHTGMDCPWGRRMFTLTEILHADRVLILKRTDDERQMTFTMHPQSGRDFREQIQAQAVAGKSWHLYAIMQHAANSGAVPWQFAIHSLLVEVIRRDIAGGYTDHKLLGKALNGLLPRRSRLADLQGNDGWADLAWLLELNQGFYNAASLAAVCSLSDGNVRGQCWLGPPIAPSEGNERLEPLVTAFPVPMGLNIINPKVLGLRQTLKRDVAGLHNNRQLVGLKWGTIIICLIIAIAAIAGISSNRTGYNIVGLVIMGLYLSTLPYCIVYLIAGSMYLVRSGWVLVYNVNNLSTWLGRRDSNLKTLTSWGDDQLVPTWQTPMRPAVRVALVDLGHGVTVNSVVLDSQRANAVVPLAVHGSGITCMLLHRSHNPFEPAHKVGIVNMPPYILFHVARSATFRVGAEPSPEEETQCSAKFIQGASALPV